MNRTHASHLTREEIVTAAVDPNDIGRMRQAHLNGCPDCRRQCDRFQSSLIRMGQMAADLAPKPTRPFRLPESRASERRWFSRPLWMLGVTAAMLLAIVIWQPQNGLDSAPDQITAAILAQDRQLMQSIDALVENALPAPYQGLASVNAPLRSMENNADDDFLDWIVPNVGTQAGQSLT